MKTLVFLGKCQLSGDFLNISKKSSISLSCKTTNKLSLILLLLIAYRTKYCMVTVLIFLPDNFSIHVSNALPLLFEYASSFLSNLETAFLYSSTASIITFDCLLFLFLSSDRSANNSTSLTVFTFLQPRVRISTISSPII